MISTAGSRVLVSVAWASRAGKRVRVCKRGEEEATRMYARLPCVALRCVTLCRVARRTAVALAHTREKSRARGVNISLYRPKTMGRWPRLPWTSIGSAVPIAGACRGWRTRAPVRRACRQRHACGSARLRRRAAPRADRESTIFLSSLVTRVLVEPVYVYSRKRRSSRACERGAACAPFRLDPLGSFFPRLMLLIRAQYPLRRDVTSTTSLYRTRFQSTAALRKHGACVYPRAGFDRRGFRFALCFRADPISR